MTRILLTIPALTASAMAQNWVNFSQTKPLFACVLPEMIPRSP